MRIYIEGLNAHSLTWATIAYFTFCMRAAMALVRLCLYAVLYVPLLFAYVKNVTITCAKLPLLCFHYTLIYFLSLISIKCVSDKRCRGELVPTCPKASNLVEQTIIVYINDDFAKLILKFVQFLQSSLLKGKIESEVAIETISTSDEYVVTQWLNETTYSYSEFTLAYAVSTKYLRAHKLRFCMAWYFYLVYVLRNGGFRVDHTSLMYVFPFILKQAKRRLRVQF